MAGWFAKLMQQGDAHSRRALAAAGPRKHGSVQGKPDPRDARFDALVQMLHDREAEDRVAREKRQRGYRQSLASDSAIASGASSDCSPVRLHRLRAKVPCRMTPEGRALLGQLGQQFAGGRVTFPYLATGRQAVMITPVGGEARQVGWVEHCVQTDPALCNVRDQGLSVDTDDGTTLVLRFRYPPTTVRMCASDARGASDGVARVEFAEVRAALELRPVEKCTSPRLLRVTRAEVETMNAMGSRDYEAFYLRFKRELLAATWSSLSALLTSAPRSRWHRGIHYTVVCEPDASSATIYQRTVDDGGHVVDIGLDGTHDAASATDILLLHLDADILTDIADIYFTLRSLSSTDAYFLKEEFFAVIRRFWASARSLASPCGSELAAVLRMAQGALPMPVQAPLLKQDWTNLRQSLVDRYGEGGRKASQLLARDLHRPCAGAGAWPFAAFAAGDVNVGLRLVYRQEWRQRGERVDGKFGEFVDQVAGAAAGEMNWPLDADGCISLGIHSLAARGDVGLETQCREASRDSCTRLTDVMRKIARRLEDESAGTASRAAGDEVSADEEADAYELHTRIAEVHNVILVAERLPSPAEIDVAWVRRHDWILATVLLDESFRDALDTIDHEARNPQLDRRLQAGRGRLYEHLRSNILHYQRAIWQQEDPQQRSMRYRKAGRKVSLEWRFELESSAALTIEELAERLDAPDVDGQFVAYADGREGELDEVIDPAGPIGYYGNCAIYHMRPEYASAELFSMLHFYKSPWLRPNRETGEAEVADPAQLLVDEAVAVETELQPAPEAIDNACRAIGPGDALDGWRIILESIPATGLLRTIGRRDVEADRMILSGASEGTVRMVGGRANDSQEEHVIVPQGKGAQVHTVMAGRAPDAAAEWVMAALGDGDPKRAGSGAGPTGEWVIAASHDHVRTPQLVAGAGAPNAVERVIVTRDQTVLTLAPIIAERESATHDAVILPGIDREGTSLLRAGRTRAGAVEWLMFNGDDAAPKLTQRAGIAAAWSHDRVILAGSDGWLRPSPVAG